MARNSRALPTALAEEDALSEPTCGTSGDYRCGTFLLYSLPGFSNYSSDQWSYGDSNPRPLACHPAATRPPECIGAGHRPRTSARVHRNPGLLRYFPAVRPDAPPPLRRATRRRLPAPRAAAPSRVWPNGMRSPAVTLEFYPSADERSSRMSVSKPFGYQMPRQLGGAMLGMTCPWSRSRTVDVGSDFKDMRKSPSCIRHMLKAPKASIREVMDEVHLSGLNPC